MHDTLSTALGSIVESPLSLLRMPWDHEPTASPSPSEERRRRGPGLRRAEAVSAAQVGEELCGCAGQSTAVASAAQAGRGGRLCLISPLPGPLPARSSRGEGGDRHGHVQPPVHEKSSIVSWKHCVATGTSRTL